MHWLITKLSITVAAIAGGVGGVLLLLLLVAIVILVVVCIVCSKKTGMYMICGLLEAVVYNKENKYCAVLQGS